MYLPSDERQFASCAEDRPRGRLCRLGDVLTELLSHYSFDGKEAAEFTDEAWTEAASDLESCVGVP